MKKFNDIYSQVRENSGKELEELRINSIKTTISILVISIVVSIVLVVYTKNLNFLIILCIFIAFMILKINAIGKYKEIFKEKVIKEFVKSYSDNLDFFPYKGVAKMSYQNAEFERFDEFHTEDLITGKILNDLNFNMAEVHTKRESTDSDKNTTTYTLFHGLFAEIELTKKINHIMTIRKDVILDGKGDGIDTKLEMDSLEFEKIFDVHTTNKIESMQILTADIMQMLIDFKTKNKIVPEITLKENMLYIRFKTGNVFEPKFMKSAVDFNSLKKYYDIITFTLELAEKFSKNILETEI